MSEKSYNVRRKIRGKNMPRGKKCRRICALPQTQEFIPERILEEEPVEMGIDELETIRLIDYENLTQEECAVQMDVSRTTVTAIYNAARKKAAQALVGGRRLIIRGGNYNLCEKSKQCCGICGRECSGCKRECKKKENVK